MVNNCMRIKTADTQLFDQEVHLWVIDLVNHPIPVNQKTLSKEELERANRFKFSEHRRSYLLCRYVLRCLLGFYLNMKPEEVEFEYNPFGKPSLKANKYRDQIHFNLSHCKNMGCIAITKNSTIGVDVEKIESTRIDMISSFMTKEEIASFSLFQSNKETALYHLWVQKEAVLKAIGTGLQTPPTDLQGIVTSQVNLRNEIIHNFYVNTFHFPPNLLAVSTLSKVNVKFLLLENLLETYT